VSARVFLHPNGDIAIQWDEDSVYVITDGTLDLTEDTHGVLDYGTWTELVRRCPFVARSAGQCQLMVHDEDTAHYTRAGAS
jgi:hypothetical protein